MSKSLTALGLFVLVSVSFHERASSLRSVLIDRLGARNWEEHHWEHYEQLVREGRTAGEASGSDTDNEDGEMPRPKEASMPSVLKA